MGTAAAFVVACRSGRIDRQELKVLLESVEGGLAYPLMVAEVCVADSCTSRMSCKVWPAKRSLNDPCQHCVIRLRVYYMQGQAIEFGVA
jgi:hypothetical protein